MKKIDRRFAHGTVGRGCASRAVGWAGAATLAISALMHADGEPAWPQLQQPQRLAAADCCAVSQALHVWRV